MDGEGQIFQISVSKGKLYAIREDGWLVATWRAGSAEIKQTTGEPRIKEEDEKSGDDPFPDQPLPGGEWISKKVKIPDAREQESDKMEAADPNNSSIVLGNDAEPQPDTSEIEQRKSSTKPLFRDYGDKPSK
jgi:hypothetical protein